MIPKIIDDKKNKLYKEIIKIKLKENNLIEDKIKFMKKVDETLELSKIPSDVRISTMTISCKILNLNFNYVNIAKYVELSFNGITDAICKVKDKDSINKKIYYRSIDNTLKNYKENVFYNQVSLHLHVNSKTKTVHCKLFTNGAIHLTGCRTIEDITETLLVIFNKLKETKYIVNKTELHPIEFVSDIEKLNLDNVTDFSINMINTNFDLNDNLNIKNNKDDVDDTENKIKIKLVKLNECLLNINVWCVYDKINRSSVNIKYINNNNTTSIIVFENGPIVITGARNGLHIFSAYIFINKFIFNNYDKIVNNSIEIENVWKIIKSSL